MFLEALSKVPTQRTCSNPKYNSYTELLSTITFTSQSVYFNLPGRWSAVTQTACITNLKASFPRVLQYKQGLPENFTVLLPGRAALLFLKAVTWGY